MQFSSKRGHTSVAPYFKKTSIIVDKTPLERRIIASARVGPSLGKNLERNDRSCVHKQMHPEENFRNNPRIALYCLLLFGHLRTKVSAFQSKAYSFAS